MKNSTWYRVTTHLTFQVLVAIVIGVLVGQVWPDWAVTLKPLGDWFIQMVKMIVPPIVFLTVALGIGSMSDLRSVGRIGFKSLGYFYLVTTLALAIGMLVVNWVEPGVGLDTRLLTSGDISSNLAQAKAPHSMYDAIFPKSFFGAFADGEMLQIVFLAILFGLGLTMTGEKAAPVTDFLDRLSKVFFKIIGIIMLFAPLGAFGAMAFVVGKYGTSAVWRLGNLMLCVYLTMFLFVVLVLGGIMHAMGISLWKVLKYIRVEILTVIGTSSSESVLPQIMEKLQRLGCKPNVVGLVIPTGYSFNLDGTSIYLSMATIFLAQATGTALTLGEQIGIIGLLMLTSKGAAGVSGSGFTVLVSTLAALQKIPVESAGLLLGVDKFMSEARSVTNLIGNTVATLVIAKSEGALDEAVLNEELGG
jgi:aerobic C4-dicarboxylate transport protein